MALYDATFGGAVLVGEVGKPALYRFTAQFVESISPSTVQMSAATAVSVRGSFSAVEGYLCRFGLCGVPVVLSSAATVRSSVLLVCATPR